MKNLLTFLVLIVLGGGGFFGRQQYQIIQARHAEEARAVAAQAAAEARERAAQAAETARIHAQQVAAAAALETARKEVETQLKAMRVTSILLGDPALAIIGKKEYAAGDPMALPQGRTLVVTAVREDGVQLAFNGLSFRLDPPAAPVLK